MKLYSLFKTDHNFIYTHHLDDYTGVYLAGEELLKDILLKKYQSLKNFYFGVMLCWNIFLPKKLFSSFGFRKLCFYVFLFYFFYLSLFVSILHNCSNPITLIYRYALLPEIRWYSITWNVVTDKIGMLPNSWQKKKYVNA